MQICAITCLSVCVRVCPQKWNLHASHTQANAAIANGITWRRGTGAGTAGGLADQQTDRNVAHKLQEWPTQRQHMAKNRKGLRLAVHTYERMSE